MKKIYTIFILTIFLSVFNCFALSTDSINAISMESYEQRWLDMHGTIALKNNTQETIHDVSFLLEYLDMQGKPLDYENFSYKIDIAPGKTKKLNIPAYEYDRNYHYYKTKGSYGHPTFKLRFKLVNYNTQIVKSNNIEKRIDNYNNSSSSSLIFVILVILFLCVYIGMYVLVAVMANKRKRNPAAWLFLSFIATPILICIILLAIGENKN